MAETPEPFHPLSSENKREGWENFIKVLPKLLERGYDADYLLPLLHRLVTKGVKVNEVGSELEFEAAVRLVAEGQPGFGSKDMFLAAADNMGPYFEQIKTRVPSVRGVPQTIAFQVPGERKRRTVDFTVFIPFRGHYRQWGKRRTNGGAQETIYAPHQKPLYDTDASGKTIERTYVGLTYRLKELADKLNRKGDELLEATKKIENPEDRLTAQLRAIAFTQLWGATILHPFADGNGRVFAAKLVYDLNRIGYAVREIPALPEIAPELKENAFAGLGVMFLHRFSEATGTPLFRPEEPIEMMVNPDLLISYMEHLSDAIDTGLDTGVDESSVYFDLIDSGANAIRLCLSRDEFIDRSFFTDSIDSIIAQNRAANSRE
jgi:hypothetical protein